MATPHVISIQWKNMAIVLELDTIGHMQQVRREVVKAPLRKVK